LALTPGGSTSLGLGPQLVPNTGATLAMGPHDFVPILSEP
jgi:hypothetical protein